ncbi:hypothetical protein [Micromonospora sp. RTP1Z1]|uniref:hypothetical protein n=1 Tax=Micromonospora sp. RTP1Z1 TaxID=2994043 RepID=UPI0029C69AFC|nr:hypothetical protein [Micromonospora sp. RTP1Z1]
MVCVPGHLPQLPGAPGANPPRAGSAPGESGGRDDGQRQSQLHPELRREIGIGRERLAEWGVPLVAGLGSADPPAHFRMLLSLIDGLFSNQLAYAEDDFDPEAAIGALLRGLLPR